MSFITYFREGRIAVDWGKAQEGIVVSVVTAVVLGGLTLLWNWGSQGGIVRALGGVTAKEVADIAKRVTEAPAVVGQATITQRELDAVSERVRAQLQAFRELQYYTQDCTPGSICTATCGGSDEIAIAGRCFVPSGGGTGYTQNVGISVPDGHEGRFPPKSWNCSMGDIPGSRWVKLQASVVCVKVAR
jgi:hypothetical protein